MEGTRQDAPRRFGLRWLAGALGIAVGAAAVVILAPSSSAATSVDAQLSLTGVATQGNILGGTTVGVHPGDTVVFKAAAVPTAGLNNIPTLGPLLNDLVTTLLGTQYQVVLHLPATFPGGKRDVTLGGPTKGACAGTPQLPVTFANIGTYPFTWNVQYVLPGLLGGCTAKSLNNSDLNLLKGIGVALNVGNQWVGQIVAATNPPPPGISIQLPGVSVAPSVTGVGQLPTLVVPNLNLPTIPVDVPSIVGTLPGGSKTPSGSGSGGTPTDNPSSPTECVPCTVVPNPGLGGGGNTGDGASGGFGGAGGDTGVLPIGAGSHPTDSSTAVPSSPKPTTKTSTTKTVNLASNKAPAAQVPVVLAIIAIIALALVTATYARLYLLRREA